MKAPICELCHYEAFLYCDSDSAFLCFTCDSTVHLANFLVARHVRHPLCSMCKKLSGDCIAGDGFYSLPPTCDYCLTYEKSRSCSSSSACGSMTSATALRKIGGGYQRVMEKIASSSSVTNISSDDSSSPVRFSCKLSSKTTRSRAIYSTDIDRKVERIFTTWCRKLGLENSDSVVTLASQALTICSGRMRGLPLRVSLAAAIWLGLRLCEDESVNTHLNVKRVEDITGVPARLLIVAEVKLGRMLRERRGRRHLEEGWAENSD